jgi:hypothetical protein
MDLGSAESCIGKRLAHGDMRIAAKKRKIGHGHPPGCCRRCGGKMEEETVAGICWPCMLDHSEKMLQEIKDK